MVGLYYSANILAGGRLPRTCYPSPLMTEPGASRAVNAMNTIRARPVPMDGSRLEERGSFRHGAHNFAIGVGGPCLAGEGFLAPNQKRAGHHHQLGCASAAAFAYASNCFAIPEEPNVSSGIPPPRETATAIAEHLDN